MSTYIAMKTPRYICSKCRQPFTRRWNANRHCNNKHYGTLDCVILFTEYLVNTENTKFLRLPDKYSVNTYQIPYQQNLLAQEKTNPMLQTIFKTSLHPIGDDEDKVILLYSKLDELAPQYQQLENILSHLSQPDRASLLGPILNMALNSENPIAFMNNQVDEFRRSKIRNRMLDDISAHLGFDKNIIKEQLKMGLK
jgi:hypothetical protein